LPRFEARNDTKGNGLPRFEARNDTKGNGLPRFEARNDSGKTFIAFAMD
jgi:hypothetical protein